ncbi:MAG: GAF domain-containing protein [Pyrinomonadaceae bacterium]|nr:GAF domain-containing protein [Sphingobacteriaceae bacterium]
MGINNWEDIFNNAPCGLHSIDKNGLYIEINDTELNWLGYSRHEILGKLKFTDLVTEESKQKFIKLFPEFIKNGFVRDEEFEMVCKDGTLFPVLINSDANYDKNNNFLNTTAYVINLTEAKRIQENLNRKTKSLEILNSIGKSISEELDLQIILQKVTDATTALTHAEFGAFFYTSVDEKGEAFQLYTLSGAQKEAFDKFGMPLATAVFHPTFSGQSILRVDDITQDERYGKNSPHYGMPSGHLPVKSYLAVPVIRKSGEVLGGLFFGHSLPGIFTQESEDFVIGIASQAAIAIENAKMFEDIKRTNEENKRLLALYQQSDRKKDEFLSIASHELKTPLTSIKAYLQILERSSQPQAGLVSKASNHVKKMERLISDLLDMSRINADNLSFKIDFFQFNEVLEECIENALHLTNTHKIIVKKIPLSAY